MKEYDELDIIRRHARSTLSPTNETRQRARANLSRAMQAESRPVAARRLSSRFALAVGVAALVVAAVTGVVGPTFAPDDTEGEGALFGPAVVRAEEGDGYTDVHFLDPSADPERIRSELESLGIDLRVTFLPADPFTTGRMVFEDAAGEEDGIEPLEDRDEGFDRGDVIGIRIPDDWSGSGGIFIGRAAEPGETFATTAILNAERPGGPLHCESVRGLSPAEAAQVVHRAGLKVEWRTEISDYISNDRPPADFTVHDVIWYASDTVLLFAEAGSPEPLSDQAAALITQGCDGKSR